MIINILMIYHLALNGVSASVSAVNELFRRFCVRTVLKPAGVIKIFSTSPILAKMLEMSPAQMRQEGLNGILNSNSKLRSQFTDLRSQFTF